MGRRGKSTLMTPDPYHIPGYCGYCPQFKYGIGTTFGSGTHELLIRPGLARSGRSVLADTVPIPPTSAPAQTESPSLLRTRTKSWGDQKLIENMVPGYTGYIPKSQNYFGSRYAEACHNAVSDFEWDQRSYQSKRAELQTHSQSQSNSLKPAHSAALPYLSPQALQHSVSPYYMRHGDPHKYFMSGYTGFVPRTRNYMGKGYPVITNEALREHGDDEQRIAYVKTTPIVVRRSMATDRQATRIYPVEAGLVPNYTGHIPAQKFKYGMTFGHSTKNAARNAVPEVVA
ncbi:ciliary microtubule inner protein 2B-like [Oscarella lobularis]|uniref:ciliary microtubule inner protein 2B-like n=1 Tax=Oscarella lobularis TaxID=121494 RepID=UPI0033141638